MSSATPAASAAAAIWWVTQSGFHGRAFAGSLEQVRVVSQLDADCGKRGPGLVQVVRDQCAGGRVDGEPAVLVRLGVLADLLTVADDVIEGDVHQATVQVDVADLRPHSSPLRTPVTTTSTGTAPGRRCALAAATNTECQTPTRT